MDALILARSACLADLGGRPLIDHQLEALRFAGVKRVVVVAGPEPDALRAAVPAGTPVIADPAHAGSGSLHAFWLAREEVEEEVLVVDGDLLFHPVIARALARRPRSAMAYDSRAGRGAQDMKVLVRGGGLSAMSRTIAPERSEGGPVGMVRLSGPAADAAFDTAGLLLAAGRTGEAMGAAISRMARDHRIDCMDVAGLPWRAIVSEADLADARDRVLPVVAPPAPRPVSARVAAVAA
jgi:choline kinase